VLALAAFHVVAALILLDVDLAPRAFFGVFHIPLDVGRLVLGLLRL